MKLLKEICQLLLLSVISTALCPQWQCSDTIGSKYYISSYQSSQIYLTGDYNCDKYQVASLFSATKEIDTCSHSKLNTCKEGDYFGKCGVYNYTDVTIPGFVQIESNLFYKTDCMSDNDLYDLCQIQDKTNNKTQPWLKDLNLKTGWARCYKDEECLSKHCTCTPSSTGEGRCSISYYDYQMLLQVQNDIYCQGYANLYCSLLEIIDFSIFQVSDSSSKPIKSAFWTSIVENDLSCIDNSQYEDTRYYQKYYKFEQIFEGFSWLNSNAAYLYISTIIFLLIV